MSDGPRVRSQRLSGLLPPEEGSPRGLQIRDPPQESGRWGAGVGPVAFGVRIQFPAPGEHGVHNKGQMKSSEVVVREGTRRRVAGSRRSIIKSIAFLKWESGVAREPPGSEAPALTQSGGIPHPLPRYSAPLPPGCTTPEAGIRRKCGVTFAAAPAAASAPMPAARGESESGRLPPIGVLCLYDDLLGSDWREASGHRISFKLRCKGLLCAAGARSPAEVAPALSCVRATAGRGTAAAGPGRRGGAAASFPDSDQLGSTTFSPEDLSNRKVTLRTLTRWDLGFAVRGTSDEQFYRKRGLTRNALPQTLDRKRVKKLRLLTPVNWMGEGEKHR